MTSVRTYVPGFQWDVFISYARIDDMTALPEQRGWVSSFVDSLNVAVTSLLGEDIRLFFDRPAAGAGNSDLDDMKIAAAHSAIFVVIASPTYPRRDWPMAELASFVGKCDDPHRLFVAERLPLDKDDRYPAILAQKNYREFWSRLLDYEAVEPLEPASPRFRACMADFAFKMQRHLRAMRAARSEQKPLPPGPTIIVVPDKPDPVEPPRPAAPRRTVLIAQPTDDVACETDKVRGHLDQYSDEIGVRPSGAYPQGGEEFRLKFHDDLAGSHIFVQLLGASPGRAPPDLPGGYTRFQLEAARAAGKTILQWRHPELDLSAIEDEAYRALLANPHVIVSGLEEFKAQVVKCALRPDPPSVDYDAAKVFVNADQRNLMTARGIAELFAAENYKTAFPKFDGTVQENRSHLYQMMAECGVVFVVNGVRPPIWWDTQKHLFDTLRPQRKKEPDGLAVCSVPPADQLQPEMIGDEFVHIDCTDGWNPRRVREYVKSLKQRMRPEPQPEA